MTDYESERELKKMYDSASSVAREALPHSLPMDNPRVVLTAALIQAQAANKIVEAIEKMTKMLTEKRFYNSFGT